MTSSVGRGGWNRWKREPKEVSPLPREEEFSRIGQFQGHFLSASGWGLLGTKMSTGGSGLLLLSACLTFSGSVSPKISGILTCPSLVAESNLG